MMVAVLEPVSIPNRALARTMAAAMPPLKRRRMELQKLHRASAMPLLLISAPARMKRGIARYAKEFVEEKAVPARAAILPPLRII